MHSIKIVGVVFFMNIIKKPETNFIQRNLLMLIINI